MRRLHLAAAGVLDVDVEVGQRLAGQFGGQAAAAT